MILRRIIEHVKEQNWTAVALDFVIVVMGVFIGLQVNNWNGERSAARIEAELLTTLEREFTELEAQLGDRIESLTGHQESVSTLLDIIRTDIEPTDRAAVIPLLDAAWSIPVLPSPPASYAESVSTGRLSTLSDPDLRRALSGYGQKVELYQLALPSMRETALGRSSMIQQAILVSADPGVIRSNFNGGIDGFDWNILKDADGDVQMALVWMVICEDLAQQQLQEVRAILGLLRKDADQ